MQKKKFSLVAVMLIALFAFIIMPLFLGDAQAQTYNGPAVPQRIVITNYLGTVTWTNGADYKPFQLSKIRLAGVLPVDATATVKRVMREGLTNALSSITVASGVAEVADTNTFIFLKNDELRFTGLGTNSGARLILEGSAIQ